MKKIKIYSNKTNVKHLERIFLALEVGKKLYIKAGTGGKDKKRLKQWFGLNKKVDAEGKEKG